MLHRFKYILVAIVLLSLSFVFCMVCYVSADSQLIHYERSKNSLLHLNNIYEQEYNGLVSDAKDILATGGTSAKHKFITDANDFISCNNRNLSYLNFSKEGKMSALQFPGRHSGETIGQRGTFSLNRDEQALLALTLNKYNELSQMLLSAVDQNDVNALHSRAYSQLLNFKIDAANQYTRLYLDRIASQEKTLQFFLYFISTVAIFLGTVLVLLASKAFFAYLKTNQYNAYFNQLYSKAIENADVGMAIVDRDQKYAYMNTTYKQLLNIQSPNPLGQTTFALLPEEISAALPEYSLSDNIRDIQLSYTFEGSMRYINYNCFSIFDDKDEPKFVMLIQDCTESKLKDQALKHQLEEIEFFANAKSSFIANVSHEIKTPLNVISGMVHILQGTNLTPAQNDILSKIHISSELLLNIINDVLDISKIQKSNFVLYSSEFNLLGMVNESEEIFKPIINNKGLELITDFRFPSSLCLSADKTRLAQVLLNLVNNACKFTSSGHIRLAIELLNMQSSSALLKFTVEDTGMGIDQEDISKVFQEFEQLENHLTKQHQGTGLGLAICKHVVTAMGGNIWVESQKGVGSRFHFTVWAPTVEPAACETASLSANSLSMLDGKGRRVLVVEDTELNYEVTQSMLADSHIVCDHACDGQEAVEICLKVPEDYYTVILMDIHMPKMDGYTAAEILKTEVGIRCPILALTATNIDQETKEKYRGIMDGFISKPFRYKEFYRILRPYFEETVASESLPPSFESQETPDSLGTSLPDTRELPEALESQEDHKADSVTLGGASTKIPSDSTEIQAKSESSDLEGGQPYPDRLSQLDLAEAARNLGCSEKLYIKHLMKFKDSYSHVDQDIQTLIMNKDYIEAHRLAHSVKGLAGTLGLVPLQQISTQLEAALKEESERAVTLLPLFQYELNGVCRSTVSYI